ncbi:Lipoamide acyltransferase component of branched-chain alpha-keto acid dehydrogenase complex [Fusarium proliferatum]|uniref:Dihydrolipoamide acetyltransferase component of pyruvate dehydrogenase complex n=1 Tax=Gibberella intermedia TaxID=948311 RepID=A0A420SRB0_GIBIN|nr:Lipoamide acyltransferase component of branched-chain alpha-keto acid dehydrogenase complex [Fusarium proliferatum]
MFLQRGSRVLQKQWHVARGMGSMAVGSRAPVMAKTQRWFSDSRRVMAVKPVVLADIGEGIVECEVIQWFVEPGARVEEFSPLCEVQSDKASVEITSRFSGVVKKLHYEAGEMAKVGKPFVDIDIEGEAKAEDVDALSNQEADKEDVPPPPPPPTEAQAGTEQQANLEAPVQTPVKEKGKCASIATPAVRHLSKELNVNIADVDGAGRDGRVLKEDIYRFVKERDAKESAQQVSPTAASSKPHDTSVQAETVVPLSNTQLQMFKTMTRSLTIPHFLYADEVDFSSLVELRKRLNRVIAKGPTVEGQPTKLSYLPFIIKAVSLALNQYPMLNARVDVDPKNNKPCLVHRSQHNIGIAMDTTGGLVVPVIKNVASLNILSIAAELSRLQALASQGKLKPADFQGGTITVSNIGNVGGTYVSPVIVEREVAILGIGRMRTVPAFDENDNVVKKQVTNFSWSADHRVIDGATMARAAEVVRQIVEEPDLMVMHLK